jgi:hydroxypyruvate reductase
VIRPTEQLRRDAQTIWQAGLAAVRSERLVAEALRIDESTLFAGTQTIPLDSINRIIVVGAGKAGAGMAEAVESVLGAKLLREKNVTGWVNVPEGCQRSLQRIHVHAARPAGVNEPTEAGVQGAHEILRLVSSACQDDLCLCLISGGGSALLPAPAPGITLEDKLAVTRHLSSAGANIEQLNTVRKQLSRVKGGGLARSCHTGRLVALVISDVLGDPLEVIASGPTVVDRSTPQDALRILEQFSARTAGVAHRVFDYLQQKETIPYAAPKCHVTNLIIANNATAVDAAGREARRLGYTTVTSSAAGPEGAAEDIGRQLADEAVAMRQGPRPDCLVSGGEPVVRLVGESRRGLGGRNQQLVLASLERLAEVAANGIAILSGGTDGEDGPTDAAGAFVDDDICAQARQRGLVPHDFLARNDAYHFFEPLGALLKTGPTHTNVGDVRVVVVDRPQTASGGH